MRIHIPILIAALAAASCAPVPRRGEVPRSHPASPHAEQVPLAKRSVTLAESRPESKPAMGEAEEARR
ncbi:MAG: hypothetical protein JNJ88_06765 [Planctomycetes bacterium]|nr:hypothetical protein [Planctomycetota bacterium]